MAENNNVTQEAVNQNEASQNEGLFAHLMRIILQWLIGYDGDDGLVERSFGFARRWFRRFLVYGIIVPICLLLIGLVCSHLFEYITLARVFIGLSAACIIAVFIVIGLIVAAGTDYIINLGLAYISADKDNSENEKNKMLLKEQAEDIILFLEGYLSFLIWLLIFMEFVLFFGVKVPLQIVGYVSLIAVIVTLLCLRYQAFASVGRFCALWSQVLLLLWLGFMATSYAIDSHWWYRTIGYDMHSFFTAPPRVTQEVLDKGETGVAKGLQKKNEKDINAAVAKGQSDPDKAIEAAEEFDEVKTRLGKDAIIPKAFGKAKDKGEEWYNKLMK